MPPIHRVLLILLCLAGGWLTWEAGHRGLFLLDQSMIFDGAWRILQGQVPYRDFFMPFGPVAFWLQSLFSALLGLTWSSMVWSAVAVHTTATLLAYRCTQRMLDNRPSIGPLVSAAITAASFQSIFGTLWFEQTAFLFNYASLWLLLESQESTCRHPRWIAAAGGCCAVLSLLSKQNALVFFLPVLGCAALRSRPLASLVRLGVSFAAGAVAGAGLFMVWLQANSAVEGWYRHFLAIPREIARARSGEGAFHQLMEQVAGPTNAIPVSFGIAAFLLARYLHSPWRIWPAVLFTLAITGFRILFQTSTANEAPNTVSQLALGTGIGCGLIEVLLREARSGSFLLRYRTSLLHLAGSLVVTAFLGWYGASKSLARPVMQFIPSTTFTELSRSPGLDGLKWGNPTRMSDYSNMTLSEWDRVVGAVRQQKRSFFVWGDATILYGLAGQQSASPLLYLGRNHSYRLKDIALLDPMLVASLRRHRVTMIVRQTRNAIEKDVNQLQDFPQSYAWVQQNFQLTHKSNFFEIYLARDESRLFASQP